MYIYVVYIRKVLGVGCQAMAIWRVKHVVSISLLLYQMWYLPWVVNKKVIFKYKSACLVPVVMSGLDITLNLNLCRGWLGYALVMVLLFMAIFMLLTRFSNQGRPINELKVVAPPPMNTMEQLLAVQNAISQVEEIVQDGNIILLKLRALLLAVPSQVLPFWNFLLLLSYFAYSLLMIYSELLFYTLTLFYYENCRLMFPFSYFSFYTDHCDFSYYNCSESL